MHPKLPPAGLPDYAELHCASNFSFLHGASHAEELVERAAQLGYAALAITDECTLAGVVRAHVAAKKHNLPLVIGSYFQLTEPDGTPALSLILLAQNREGYGNLSEMITHGRTHADKGNYRLHPDDLCAPQDNIAHLRGMPDCLAILTPRYGVTQDVLVGQAAWMHGTFPGRCWIALTQLYRARDERHREVVEAVARDIGLPVVATGDVCMHLRSRKPLQDTLTAIRLGKTISTCGFHLHSNAERHLRSRLRLSNLFPPVAMAQTLKITALCNFSLDSLRYEYPNEVVPDGYTPDSYLRQETYVGARRRYPNGIPAKVQTLIEHELQVIEELHYAPYFLTVYDIVCFARSNNILAQGRGSAANSAVCFCLGVTEVDPDRSSMLFERFVSASRGEPPDIDVDFSHERRAEIYQYVYAKYGRDRAAITGVVTTYRPRSTLRDVGKALAVDLTIVDQVAKSHSWWDGKTGLAERFVANGLDPASRAATLWASLSETLLGFPRHLSQHPCGMVITRGKLSRLVPIENAAMKDRSVVQWDKDDLDALGLLKIDLLALGALSMIRRALDLMSQQRGELFELQDIPPEDCATYDMLGHGHSVGCFQIESRSQINLLPRLKPRTFYDLVIQVALVRPGPIQGDMVHPYLRRRNGEELVSYASPAIEEALSRTLGIPIFQEQVMQVAILAAGFSPVEADQLRRAMAAWKRKGGLEKYHDKLITGMLDRGYTQEFADSIFRQIQGFSEYGFPESHAASFALLAYVTAWLKCHEPEVFLCALLNSQPMGFYSPSQLVQDARRNGVVVLPVDVTVSCWDAALESIGASKPAVRLGLNNIKGMQREAAWRIEEARAVKAISDVRDLAMRAQLGRRELEVLAGANALLSLAGHRREALWHAVVAAPEKGLLKHANVRETEPVALRPQTEAQAIVADYGAVGLTLGRHPLALLRNALTAKRFLPTEVLNTFADGQFARGCGIVTGRQRPETAKGVIFLTIEDETGNTNVIVWPALVEAQRKEVLGAKLLGVYGIWQAKGEVRHLVAKRLVDMSYLLGDLSTSSRDFA